MFASISFRIVSSIFGSMNYVMPYLLFCTYIGIENNAILNREWSSTFQTRFEEAQ